MVFIQPCETEAKVHIEAISDWVSFGLFGKHGRIETKP